MHYRRMLMTSAAVLRAPDEPGGEGGAEGGEGGAAGEGGEDDPPPAGESEGDPPGDGEGDPPAGAEAGAEGDKKPARQPWHIKRIGALTAKTNEQQAEIDRLRALVPAEAPGGDGAPGPTPVGDRPTTADGKPLFTEDEIEKRAAAKAHLQTLNEKADAMFDAGAKAFGKTWEAQINAAGQAFGQDLARRTDFFQALTELPNGPAVYHSLTADLDEMADVLALPPIKLGMRLAEISAKAAAPAGRQVSKAPPPIEPIDGNSEGAGGDPKKGDMKSYAADFEKRREKRFGAS